MLWCTTYKKNLHFQSTLVKVMGFSILPRRRTIRIYNGYSRTHDIVKKTEKHVPMVLVLNFEKNLNT